MNGDEISKLLQVAQQHSKDKAFLDIFFEKYPYIDLLPFEQVQTAFLDYLDDSIEASELFSSIIREGKIHSRAQELEDSYEILQNLHTHQAHRSHTPRAKMEEVGRVKAILSYLPQSTVVLDKFTLAGARDFIGDQATDPHRLNIYYFPRPLDLQKQTVVFLAHYDVVDERRDNIMDNAASVANVISIAKRSAHLDLSVNVVAAITDAEEIVSFTDSGSKRLADKINAGYFGEVREAINLELTAYGNIKWVSGKGRLSNHVDFQPVRTPYNDAVVLEKNGISAVCIGIFTNKDAEELQHLGYCRTWQHCHSSSDNFDLANQQDMETFVTWLLDYIKESK